MVHLRKSIVGACTAALVVSLGMMGAQQADAAPPKATRYATCVKLNAVYPHGVARPNARDLVAGKVTRTSVRNFTVRKDVYALNIHLDRDRDGVACEKR